MHHKINLFALQKKPFNQMILMWFDLLLLLQLLFPFVCGILDRNKIPTQLKCSYSFLTESAICANSSSLAQLAQEFRPGWKHINVVSSTGSFSLEGITLYVQPMLPFFHQYFSFLKIIENQNKFQVRMEII